MANAPHQIVPVPRARRLVIDVGRAVRGRAVIRGLLELDVTEPRRRIQAHQERTGERLSFTAFLASCAGRAIDAHPAVHACRDWRGRSVIYEAVDISTMVEVERDGKRFPVGHLVRGANRKSPMAISAELRAIQERPSNEKNVRRLMLLTALPGFLRRFFLWLVDRSPALVKRIKGTVVLTSVGMFGRGAGWAIALPTHTLGIAVGGIALKPWVVDGRIEPREILHLTLDFDHDAVDGAPAARFAQQLAELIEAGAGLPE